MYISFFETAPILKDYFKREAPESILIISKSARKYENFIKDLLKPIHGNTAVNCININEGDNRNILSDVLNPNRKYDCIFITDLFENTVVETAYSILDLLLKFTEKSIITIIPTLCPSDENSGSLVRKYHPVVFKQYDFSYYTYPTSYGECQFYTFFPQKLQEKTDALIKASNFSVPDETERKKLTIGYIPPHKQLTGGLKYLLEHMRQLHKRGHKVYAVYKSDGKSGGNSPIPDWSDIVPGRDITGQFIISKAQDIAALGIKFDILMLGFINQVPEYIDLNIPLFYWEQGYEGIYGDYKILLDSGNKILKYLRMAYRMPLHILSVSDIVSEALFAKYRIRSDLLYTGIDTDFYSPVADKKFDSTILLVGNPILKFKNFKFAIQILTKAWALGCRFKVKWACQVKPETKGLPFPIEYYVMAPQNVLAELYRSSDIFLFTSLYESFPMPPIEAMASGTPGVAADCGGIKTYARPGDNILLFDQGDIDSAAAALAFLLENEEARSRLTENGLKTAHEYSFDRIIGALENYFYNALEK